MTDSEIRQRILYVCKVDGADSDFNVVAFHALCDALIAAEREACAKACDAIAQEMEDQGEGPTGYISWVEDCAKAIRARGLA